MRFFAVGSHFPTILSSTFVVVSLMLLANLIAVMAASWEGKSPRTLDDQDDKWLVKQADSGIDNDFNGDNSEYMEKLASLLYPRRRMALFDRWNAKAEPEKRQVRYHQCYFNPVSCFRKRK